MPLIYVQRYAPPTAISTDGTQYVDGALSFAGATTIVLSEAIYSTTQQYVLFDYSGPGSFPTPAQLSNVTVDTSNLILSEFDSLTNDTTNSRIILTLKSLATNGKQFVDGDLNFAGSTTVILNSTLYATTGVYELFDVTGSISNFGNLTCVSSKGFSATTSLVAGSPNKIYVTLA